MYQKDQKTPVSVFINRRSTMVFKEAIIEKWITSDKYKDQVIRYRSSSSRFEKQRILMSLPAISPLATFEGIRSEQTVKKYTNLIFAKITGDAFAGFKDVEEAKFYFGEHVPNTLYCGLSLSGKSLNIIHKVEWYEQYGDLGHLGLEADFEIGLGIYPIQQGHLTDTMVASFDPNPYVNFSALDLSYFHKPLAYRYPNMAPAERQYINMLMATIEEVKNSEKCTNDRVVNVLGIELGYQLGENGRRVFHEIWQRRPDYNETQCDDKYDRLLRSNRYHTVEQLEKAMSYVDFEC